MKKEEFIQKLQAVHIELTQTQMDQFETYMHLLQEWNQKMNLTSIVEDEQIWEKHFFDSIVPFADMSFDTFCDVGSGAGFPGIPVAIVFPHVKVTLVEPLKKRCRFLEVLKDELQLSIQIYADRAEDHVKKHREAYDIVGSRAVARMTMLLELCSPLVREQGYFVALKGKNGHDELRMADVAMHTLKVSLDHETIVSIGDAEHVNFYFKKEAPTPKKYPRAYGQIKKKPLGE